MVSFNVFGDALNAGDPNRRQIDRTGFMTKLIGYMPRANAFNGGASCTAAIPCDGLNTAIHRWVQRTIGGDGSTGASADVFKREQYHIKIDHHFNQNHTLSGSFDKEYRYSDNNALTPWPNGWSG